MNAKKKTIKVYIENLAWLIDPILLICSINLLVDMHIKITFWTYCAAGMLLILAKRYTSDYKTPETTITDFHQDRDLTPTQAAALDAAAARPPVKIKARDLPSRNERAKREMFLKIDELAEALKKLAKNWNR